MRLKTIIPFFCYLLCLLFYLALVISCHKEPGGILSIASNSPNGGGSTLATNHAPIANAGADVSVNIASCAYSHWVGLDGSMSLDQDGNDNIIRYEWSRLSGPSTVVLINDGFPKAQALFRETGQYAFILKVTDQANLSSADTVLVTVTGTFVPTEFTLNETINIPFHFSQSVRDCYDEIWGVPLCRYYDLTTIEAGFALQAFGQIDFRIYEEADTAGSATNHETQFGLSCTSCPAPARYIGGTCSVNFKRLIQQGGGDFSGSMRMESGSAESVCNDPHVFDNAALLTITGSLDTTAHVAHLRIQGKVYF
jgi:K319-like protein